MKQPTEVIEAVVAHEVAHEVLGHIGDRRRLSLSIFAGFTLLGVVAPGVGLLDLIVNPLAVRAFSRHQELQADHRAVEILSAMGHREPEASMARALRTLDRTSPRPTEGLTGLLSTHPTLEERLTALGEPPPAPVAPPYSIVAPAPSPDGSVTVAGSRFWSADAHHTRP
jgi:Zn-dependent protease with chaperone function